MTTPLNLPALGRRQPPYVVFTTLRRPVFLVNSRLGHFSATSSSRREATLLPKLRVHFAEFLNESSHKRLRILTPPTCVGLRYGLIACIAEREFSWQLGSATFFRFNPYFRPTTYPEQINFTQETLGLRRAGFSPALSLLMPTESFLIAPTVLPVPLHSYRMLAYHDYSSSKASVRRLSPVVLSAQGCLTSELLRFL